MTTHVSVAPLREATSPGVAEVFVHSVAQIHQAAADLWPGLPVGLEGHLPRPPVR
ncbi:hypothetical protein [Streptomyces sp. NPDC093984]|uniref:hypothetical protein n=1 Tax=Streptomyces sp. NPDC093984 TaxID=3366052 RepID=UPI00380AC240